MWEMFGDHEYLNNRLLIALLLFSSSLASGRNITRSDKVQQHRERRGGLGTAVDSPVLGSHQMSGHHHNQGIPHEGCTGCEEKEIDLLYNVFFFF